MKKVILALMAALMVLPFSVAAKKRKPADINVISYNIRVGTAKDGTNSWEYRYPVSAMMIMDQKTKKTGEIMHDIINLSADEHPVFDKSEVVILLAMRNNRRLLQNAEACLESLHRLHRTDNGQATAYLWMILQLWISLDGFAYALMDEEQMRTMEKLAERTPKALTKLEGADFPLDAEGLPALLIKTFILGYE